MPHASTTGRGALAILSATALVAGVAVATAGPAPAATHISNTAHVSTTYIGASSSSRTLAANTKFYVDPGSEAAHQAVTDLLHHDFAAAITMAKLASWPEAVWFTKGTPGQVRAQVSTLVRRAAAQRAVPVLVAYNIPLRDCSQYSAGGAQSDADYQAWLDVAKKSSYATFAKAVPDGQKLIDEALAVK